MAKTGPKGPRIVIDDEELKKLSAMGCTMKEMSSFFNCSVDTLERNYADIISVGREQGKSSVRRMLWLHGQKGNTVALKYLIHNVLKERLDDGIEVKLFSDAVSKLSDDELNALAVQKLRARVDAK